MTRSTVNLTNRKRLLHLGPDRHVLIVRSSDGNTFDAEFNITGLGLPWDAAILVDASHRTNTLRFDYGTVSSTVIPEDRNLGELSDRDDVRFSVSVVDSGKKRGLLLASSAKIQAERPVSEDDDSDGGRTKFLDLIAGDIDGLWKLELSGGSRPEFVRNKAISMEFYETPSFQATILPVIIKEVMIHMFLRESEWGADPESAYYYWNQFLSQYMPPEYRDDAEQLVNVAESSVVLEAIDDTIGNFLANNSGFRKLKNRIVSEHEERE
mgnify:CR=1 FL=1|tara:strand:- start:5187 stop:5987 length:801 start_codon:yes stop_codon:yes gene_type:complete